MVLPSWPCDVCTSRAKGARGVTAHPERIAKVVIGEGLRSSDVQQVLSQQAGHRQRLFAVIGLAVLRHLLPVAAVVPFRPADCATCTRSLY